MFQPVSLFIGYRYSSSGRRSGFVSFITFFSIAGILLGVASLITVVSVMNGFESELKKRILGLVPHVMVSSESQSTLTNWRQLSETFTKLPHVKHATPINESEALIQSTSVVQMAMMQGITPELENHNIVAQRMTYGQLTDLSPEQYSVIIGEALGRQLNVTVGDNVRIILPNNTVFTPMGRMPVQRVFIIAGFFNVGSQVDNGMVYVHSANAAKLLRHQANSAEKLRLYLDDAFNVDQVISQISAEYPDYELQSWRDTQGHLFSAVQMEKKMMGLSLALIVAVAAFNIVSALVMVVIDKRAEIGILQTFGMTRAGIVKIFISQGMINGLWGALLGVLLGIGLAYNLNNILALTGINILGSGAVSQQLPIDIQAADVVMIAFSAIAMCFIATLYPAFNASNTKPAEVLRNE
ncbi:lipoprotein-releasing ABC transporter permease subunit [Thalassotalea ganghwensis]